MNETSALSINRKCRPRVQSSLKRRIASIGNFLKHLYIHLISVHQIFLMWSNFNLFVEPVSVHPFIVVRSYYIGFNDIRLYESYVNTSYITPSFYSKLVNNAD